MRSIQDSALWASIWRNEGGMKLSKGILLLQRPVFLVYKWDRWLDAFSSDAYRKLIFIMSETFASQYRAWFCLKIMAIFYKNKSGETFLGKETNKVLT